MTLKWTDFFAFSKDDKFDIKEFDNWLDSLVADGKVVDIDGNKLILEINIPNQTLGLSGFLPDIAGLSSLPVPEIKGEITITLLQEGVGNQLIAKGTYVDSTGSNQDFNYVDNDLKVSLRRGGGRLRLDASNSFLSQISNDNNISSLARLEFQKTSNVNETEMDIGKFPFGEKIEILLIR